MPYAIRYMLQLIHHKSRAGPVHLASKQNTHQKRQYLKYLNRSLSKQCAGFLALIIITIRDAVFLMNSQLPALPCVVLQGHRPRYRSARAGGYGPELGGRRPATAIRVSRSSTSSLGAGSAKA